MKRTILFLVLAALICVSAIDVLDIYTESQVKKLAKDFSESDWYDSGLYAMLSCNLDVQLEEYSGEEDEQDYSDKYKHYKENWLRRMVNTPSLMHLALKKYGDVFMETMVTTSLQNGKLDEMNKRLEEYSQVIAMYEKLLPLLLQLDEPTLNLYIQNYGEYNDAEKQLQVWLINYGFMTENDYETYYLLGNIGALLCLTQRMGSNFYIPPKQFLTECYKFLEEAKPLIPQKISIEKAGERTFQVKY